MLRQLHPVAFVIAFCVGILYVYTVQPEPTVVVKFPTPYNAGQHVYTDKAGTCYTYRADQVTCPADRAKVKPQPIQEDMAGSGAGPVASDVAANDEERPWAMFV